MKATVAIEQFLADLHARGVQVRLEGDRLRCSAPPGALTAETQEVIRQRKPEILNLLSQGTPSHRAPPLHPRARSQPPPLSFGQQRIWFLHQLEPQGTAFNVPAKITHRGPLDPGLLNRIMTEIVRRHEVLRTTFALCDGLPVQIIAPPEPIVVPVLDLQHLPESEREAAAEAEAQAEARRPFDLERGPVWRACLLRLADDRHTFLYTMHHIVCDRWSLGLFFREVEILEQALVPGRESPLPELPIQYADYAAWQRDWLRGDVLASQMDYWRRQLGGALPVLDLPTDRPRPPLQSYRAASLPVVISPNLTQSLAAVSQASGATLFMTLLAVFKVLLYRYSGQDDLLVGTPIANRGQVETERLIGFFLNTLVLRTRLQGRLTFRELLARVREAAIGAYAHQDMPFEKLVEELHPERDLSRSPLFQVMFVLQNVPKRVDVSGMGTLGFTSSGATTYDLSLDLGHSENGLRGYLDYNVDLYDDVTAERLLGHYQTLLEAVAADPSRRIEELPLLTAAEDRQLLEEFSGAAVERVRTACVHRLFEEIAASQPDAPAAVLDDTTMCYGELDARANQVAHALVAAGVKPGSLAILCLERSLEMLIALLAVLKAGAAFVPAEPSSPPERLAFLLEDTGAPVIITDRQRTLSVPAGTTRIVRLDLEDPELRRHPESNPAIAVGPEGLAYLIYTSGSTGQPKGVMVPHRALSQHVLAARSSFELGPKDRILQFSSLTFDAALEQVFGALTVGAQAVLRGPTVWLPSEFEARLHRHGLTVVDLPTAYWEQLARQTAEAGVAREAPELRLVIVGGDTMPAQAISWWHQTPWQAARLVNAYGPTEGVITSTLQDLPRSVAPQATDRIPIGRPLPGKRVYILDAAGHGVPIGVPGELCVGGEGGLAYGYWRRPDWTAERFLPDPFGGVAGAVYYRTGDRARFRVDGTIEFLGRDDDQVKIRGYRVEPGEVEAVLRQHGMVQESAVLVRAEVSGPSSRLVAYVTPRPGARPKPAELRDFVRTRVPDYLVPAAVVVLDALPYTPGGKVDRQALPAPELSEALNRESRVAPRDPLELQLTKIWELVLGRSPVGVTENFFDAGGHSLLAVTLFSRIERALGRQLPLVTLYQHATIEGQAAVLRDAGWQAPWDCLVPLQPGGSRPPFYLVHGVGGNILWCRDLVRRLGADQPCYGLQAQGLDPEKPTHDRVEAMASHYLQQVRNLQPAGPYYLGGFCMGGMIAFEMGRQLEAAGERVGMVALMEAHGPDYFLDPADDVQYFYEERTLGQRLLTNLARLRTLPPAQRGELLRSKVALVRERLGVLLSGLVSRVLLGLGHRTLAALHRVHQANIDAQIRYRPEGRLSGRIDLFRCEKQPLGNYRYDPLHGWGPFAAGPIQVHTVPGWHSTLLHEPHVSVFAQLLRDALRASHAQPQERVEVA